MFLAGETLETARSAPTSADRDRQQATGRYWWASLSWWIRCDDCGRLLEYRGGPAWEPSNEGGHRCVSCPARPEQHTLFDC